ncbi:MAG: site-specific integrase [Nitrosopumilus sp.]|nr:site-specific integrase [Nitrosopumilus sp.]
MEITLEKINERSEPYQLFLDSVKSKETLRRYRNLLQSFLKLIPNQIYQDNLGEIPEDKEHATLAEFFVRLTRKNPDLASDIIAAYIKEDKKKVDEGILSAQTLPNHLKPIKVLLDSNRVALHWKSLSNLLPRFERGSNDRAYTREEIQKMLEISKDITDNVILLMFSSAGFRLEAWDYFTWKDLTFFRDDGNDGDCKGAALLVYRGDPESYWTFVTPETCKALDLYREKWKSDIGRYPKPDDPLIKSSNSPVIHRLEMKGVRKRVDKIVTGIGLRPPLQPGQKRHAVKLDHGFRKYFNTMMRRAKVNFLDKEDMMGHKVGLERHYERYNEEDFERFSEYQKAIPFLTISDKERQKIELEKKHNELKEEKTAKRQLEKKVDEMKELNEKLSDFEKLKQELRDEFLDEIKNLKASK